MAVGSLRHQHPKRKSKMASFRVLCRSVLDHPFLILTLLFLIGLHRYFPFLFFLLVSASPVIICAAILLGTLLIYGQPNDNNVKYHEEMSNTCVTTGVDDHTYSADKERITSKDRFSEVRNEIVEKGMRASGMLSSGIRVTGDLANVVDWEYCNSEHNKGSSVKEKSNNSFGFADFEKANAQMPWDRDFGSSIKVHRDADMQGIQADDTANHKYSNRESDRKEKSSFDAFVADVIPTSQETRPLLDSEDQSHRDASHGASVKFDLQSIVTDHSSEDSGDDDNDDDSDKDETLKAKDNENKVASSLMEREKSQQLESLFTRAIDERDEEEESEDDESNEDDDYDDDEEEENTNVEKDESKPVTMWTEEDEKNLRLVGNSELERDLRLENLLARRRAKRNFSMISERNLIDLDRPDTPFQVPPISTARVNPFDTPVSTSQQQSGIPPIPGSAPSVSVPRKNPFESPCTSPKGVHNLVEELKEENLEMNLNDSGFHENGSSSTGFNPYPMDSIFKPDFVEVNRKEAVFRRYESFSTGYNIIGDASRHDFMETDRREAVLRRHETFNTRSTFQNVTTPEKLAYLKMKPVFVPEQVGDHQEMRHHSSGRESSHDNESSVSSSDSDHTESQTTLSMHGDVESNKGSIAASDHASSHSEDTGSESSDSVDSLRDDPEEYEASLNANAEVHADQIYQKAADAATQNEDDTSSSTSMTSEVNHSSEKLGRGEDEAASNFVDSPKASSSMSDANPVSTEEDHGIIEPPVYDSSPSGTDKVTPFSMSDAQE